MHKIVIVGGGSAGWMSAAILKKSFPSKEIIVIEDKNTPIVGVGESTLSGIKEFIHYLEIDEENFLKEVDGSYKMAIKFTDFYKKDSGSFYYPFGNPFVDNINDNFTSWMIKKHIYNIEDQNDFVKTFFPSYYLFNNNKFNKNENNEFDNFNPWTDVAYHFDAIKFSLWLKNNYCLPTGVKNEYRKIVDAKVGNDGIEYLIDEKNEKIYADLFVDCTGFQSLLISSFLKEPFESFNDILPNNSAWATKITYKDKEKELVPYTNCTAIANGWVWNIPLWSRMGSGYVFSDKYISDEDALIEFKDYLCSSKLEVTRDAKEIEELEYKKIKMKVGIHKKTFVKNVVAIGLSAGFIEPLESNGLFSVHTFLFHLVKSLQRERVTQWDKDQYNFVTYSMFKNFADFVALHYLLSIRDDSKYWQENTKRSILDQAVDSNIFDSQFRSLFFSKSISGNIKDNGGINYISIGMNYPVFDKVFFDVAKKHFKIDLENTYKNDFNSMELNRKKWINNAESSETLYEYLKNKYY